MNLSHLNTEERTKFTLENLSKTNFSKDNLILEGDGLEFYNELKKQFGKVHIEKLKIDDHNNILWGSLGMQLFTNELLNSPNLKNAIPELLPFEERYELKNSIRMQGNLFNLLGDLCSMLKSGGCYGSGTALKNDEIIRITKEFIDLNLKEGYKMYHYIQIQEAWTKWFDYQAIFAVTFLLLNMYRDEMLMICISDVD